MDQLQNAETLGQVGTTSMDRLLDAAVIGAGWAGLGVSYVLAKAGLSHRVLERFGSARPGSPNAGILFI
jgi:2-polyprenyl-6-methoxyphenol hydroxylase-like FAD-dependent oxidoreductase